MLLQRFQDKILVVFIVKALVACIFSPLPSGSSYAFGKIQCIFPPLYELTLSQISNLFIAQGAVHRLMPLPIVSTIPSSTMALASILFR